MKTLGELEVGSYVKIPMNLTYRSSNTSTSWVTEQREISYIVVQQGRPSSRYDVSCDGTWLKFANNYSLHYSFNDRRYNDYKTSTIHKYLNEDFLYQISDINIRNSIKTVKIPYHNGPGDRGQDMYGSDGLQTKIFLLSEKEVMHPDDGIGNGFFNGWDDGDTLDLVKKDKNWFRDGYIMERGFFTRTPEKDNYAKVAMNRGRPVYAELTRDIQIAVTFILPKNMRVDDNGNLHPNTPPSNPSSISVPETVYGGKGLTVSWGASSDADGNLSGYRLYRKYHDTDWTQVYSGSNRSYTDTITYGKTTVQYRVNAYDSYGEVSSSYATSPIRTIVNNNPPTIDGNNRDLGTFSATAPNTTYIINDADGDSVQVKVQLDNVQIKSFTASLGATNTLTCSATEWQKIRNGKHTWRVTATDSKGESTIRTITFTKNVTAIEFTSAVLSADDMPTKAIFNIQGAFPSGCKLLIEACNNGNDAVPTWQDVTGKVQAGEKVFFGNHTKTAENWGVKLHVKLERGTASGDCYITAIGGNFG